MITRRGALKRLAAGAAGATFAAGAATAETRPNVLFVIVDDLNSCISPLTPEQGVITPSFERLRDWGATFECAYAAVPACGPSRTATFLGMSPASTGIYVNGQSWHDARLPPGAHSLFGQLRAAGWDVRGTGKIFHRSHLDLRDGEWDDYWNPDDYFSQTNDDQTDTAKSADGAFDFGPSDRGQLNDVACADWVIDHMQRGDLDAGGRVLALGLNRPHLPFAVGQPWFDLYRGPVTLPPGYWPGAVDLAGNLPDQEDLGPIARRRIAPEIGDRLTANDELQDFLRGYYAATTFADAQLGRVMDALEARGLRDNTCVVVTADHGFMLGEKRDFLKFELREIALRVPLFIAGPGVAPQVVRDPVSLVDIYPTLCALVGGKIPDYLSGQDLSGALLRGEAPPRSYALSFNGALNRKTGSARLHLGLRTPQWRLIDYGRGESLLRFIGLGGGETELYDHDPSSPGFDPHEWRNLAGERPDVVRELRGLLPDFDSLYRPETFVTEPDDE